MPLARAEPRRRRLLKLSLGGKVSAVTTDVSPGGFAALLDPVFIPGSVVHGTVQLEGEWLPFRGEVAWARPGNPERKTRSRIGVKFIESPLG
jgi:hypothetical protein